MEDNIICPYPGLRPFNEDESIFFKGREEHINQIIKQLEQKKFLMLTGASGDGKSSLVYAGVIPSARAGFFKARFNNWIIADFRPERNPLNNFAHAIDSQLKIGNVEKTEKELSYGFSALIDLYQASPYWLNQSSETFLQLNVDEQKKAKRKAANLLILVDQFEEFFTNIENYSNGKASLESQAVVNLLLETTRIAIEQDIPIYIVCTMRSDYIGQCASFRGLPEYIGYSQFFVPRLKRQEFYQVIEEPALLNGNKIAHRLVEMLINEMSDGIDQLPVLQHALNQIWQKADKGKTEMDLIHFAKINGIPKNQLDEESRAEFENWFTTIPDFKKDFFDNSSLGDVLDAHANELYETAFTPSGLDKSTAKLIIETTFKCLTKIDEARAVRNRMSLEEVTQIINQPNITTDIVAQVIDVYREQGNTFLKPFITAEHDTLNLKPNNVLDITHESLIRNWKKLTDWAKEEHDSLLTWQDFNKQLQRWVASNRSSGYLLPIGPLTYFENWFKTAKPNKYWLARYDDGEISKEQKIADAEIVLSNAILFLKRSARRLFVTRTIMKYGADKIIAAFGILSLVFSCTYFYFDFRTKQNDYILEDIQQKSHELLSSKNIKSSTKATYIIVESSINKEKKEHYKTLLNYIESDSARIEVCSQIFSQCAQQKQNVENKEIYSILTPVYMYQLELANKNMFVSNKTFANNIHNVLNITLENAILIRNIKYANKEYKLFCNNAFKASQQLLNDTLELKKINTDQLSKLFIALPFITDYNKEKITQIINTVSPFNAATKQKFDLLFPKDKKTNQTWNEEVSHNGGYFHLGSLYAITGDYTNLNNCLDSLLIYNSNFLTTKSGFSYEKFLINLLATNNLLTTKGVEFVNKIESKFKIVQTNSVFDLLQINLCASKEIELWELNQSLKSASPAFYFDVVTEKVTYTQVNQLIDFNINKIVSNHNKTNDEKKYLAALLYKAKAYLYNKSSNYNEDVFNINTKLAVDNYKKVSQQYLNGDMLIGSGSDAKSIKRSVMFNYPDLIDPNKPWALYTYWSIIQYKKPFLFLKYIVNTNQLATIYNDENSIVGLNKFIANYCITALEVQNRNKYAKDAEVLEKLITFENKSLAKDPLYAMLAIQFNSVGNKTNAKQNADKVNYKTILEEKNFEQNSNGVNYQNLAQSFAAYLALTEQIDLYREDTIYTPQVQKSMFTKSKTFQFINSIPKGYVKRNALLVCLDSLQSKNHSATAYAIAIQASGNKIQELQQNKDPLTYLLLDNLINTQIYTTQKFANGLFEILGRLSTNSTNAVALTLLKDKNDKIKPLCLNYFVEGVAQTGNYYLATSYIPDYVSSSSQLQLYTIILNNEAILKERSWLTNSLFTNPFTGKLESDDDGRVYVSSED
ncbi:MAG: ATP-binding protein [Bacteroidota bacterium]